MSTKIYYAYRIKKDKWIEFIDIIHDQMLGLTLKHVEDMMKIVEIDEEKVKLEIKKYAPLNKNKQKNIRKWAEFEVVMDYSEKATAHPERNLFNIDCGINFWMHGHYVYAIPIAPYHILDKLNLPKWVEDYAWNNTDEPVNVTDKQWQARGDTWKKVNCGQGRADHNARRLFHSVISMDTYISKHELQTKIFPRN